MAPMIVRQTVFYSVYYIFVLKLLQCQQPTFDPNVLKKAYDQVQSGKYLDNQNKSRLGSDFGITFLDCVEECLCRQRCRSINYFTKSKFCHWNYDIAGSSNLKTNREDAKYTEVTTEIWHPGLIGACEGHTCAENEACERLPQARRRCVISDCGILPILVDNAEYEIPDGIAIEKVVFYTCRQGYKINDTKSRTFSYCRPNGNWSTPKFTCDLINCTGPLPVVANASVSDGNYSYGMKAHYTCNPGFQMKGTGYIVCQENGAWTKPNFHCEMQADSCRALYNSSLYAEEGVYNISIAGKTKTVYCEGEWLVIQRRNNNESPKHLFKRGNGVYKRGFGDPAGHYWIGNDILHNLTSEGNYELKMCAWETSGALHVHHANFKTFKVGSAEDNYKLTIGEGTGNLSQDMSNFNNKPFYTSDYGSVSNTNFFEGGGWWINEGAGQTCFNCYLPNDKPKILANGILSSSSIMKIKKT